MRDEDGLGSFAGFVRVKWMVFVLLVLVFAYFSTTFAGGLAHLNFAKWIPLVLTGAGEALVLMFYWYRLGRTAWYVFAVWYALQMLARTIRGI